MKALLLSLLLSVSTFAGEEAVKIKSRAATCGEAGVQSHAICEERAAEDGYRVLDVKVEFEFEAKTITGECVVSSVCSFYQIVD